MIKKIHYYLKYEILGILILIREKKGAAKRSLPRA
jgi:hypothetical protein